MQIACVSTNKDRPSADVVFIPVWSGGKKPVFACEGKEFHQIAKLPIESGDFLGKEGETLMLYAERAKEKRVLLVGLGKQEKCETDTFRRAYSCAVKAARSKKLKSASVLFPEAKGERSIVHTAVVEGVLLSNYAFDQLKGDSYKDRTPSLEKLCFCGVSKKEEEQIRRTEEIVHSVDFVRDLVNGNADDVHVEHLEKVAKDFSKEFASIHLTILDKKALQKEKMGLLLAVGRGAVRDPALIILEYKGDPLSKERIAIVGKGITYDTGGLSLKIPGVGIETMKCDMAGCAAVLGVVHAAAKLKLKKNIIAVLSIAENAIGPNSYKPGDVYKGYSGKTVEIISADAEGRLVLADAIAYVEDKYAPAEIIDLATLTGGIVVALGEEATGLFSNNDKLARALIAAGERTYERMWRMPLYTEYLRMLKSSVADIKNSAARKASSGTAAVFIQQFVKKTPWAHLDIAGTAYLSELKPYQPTYATGVGVRLLIDYLEHRDGKGK